MHDSVLLRALVDPVKLLKNLGIKKGYHVVEVGCGPGFYTIGASGAVGPEGETYAFDVNPYAIAYVKEKLGRHKIQNVNAMRKNAAETGLSDSSVDFAFVTGVPHVVGGRSSLLNEMTRILKQGGTLAYRPSRGSRNKLIKAAESLGMHYRTTEKRFLIFTKVA